MRRIRVLLADDHPVIREGLKALLGAEPDIEVVAEAADGPEAVSRTAELDPDIVVVDVSMPGLNGAEVTAKLREARPDRKVVALTVHEDKGYLRLLLEAGAVGYVLKRSAAAELVRAIRAVAEGGTYIDPTLTGALVDNFVHPVPAQEEAPVKLSAREAEVVRLIAQGHSNKEIASQLKVSVKTVETYKSRATDKLRLNGRVGIVKYAAQRGWLSS